jgi:hypothetical protein
MVSSFVISFKRFSLKCNVAQSVDQLNKIFDVLGMSLCEDSVLDLNIFFVGSPEERIMQKIGSERVGSRRLLYDNPAHLVCMLGTGLCAFTAFQEDCALPQAYARC